MAEKELVRDGAYWRRQVELKDEAKRKRIIDAYTQGSSFLHFLCKRGYKPFRINNPSFMDSCYLISDQHIPLRFFKGLTPNEDLKIYMDFFSSMSHLWVFMVKGQTVIRWGLHEADHPPTLIAPLPISAMKEYDVFDPIERGFDENGRAYIRKTEPRDADVIRALEVIPWDVILKEIEQIS